MEKIEQERELYLDACSTTPPRQEVIAALSFVEGKYWANPSSIHRQGIQAAEQLELNRIKIASLINSNPDDIIFTSGATESIKLAIRACAFNQKPGRIVISAVEHPCVIDTTRDLVSNGWDLCFWPVDFHGKIKLECLEDLLSPPTKIVSLIWAQSEIGTIQPVELIANECRKRNILFHTDATQYLSQSLINWKNLDADFLSASAHKFRGPKGIGFLLNRSKKNYSLVTNNLSPAPQSVVRHGTEALALITGMRVALEMNYKSLIDDSVNSEYRILKRMTIDLRNELSLIKDIKFTGHPQQRLLNHISMIIGDKSSKPILGRKLVRMLSEYGIYVSSGTACSSTSENDSHVLIAIGVDSRYRKSSLRICLGSWLIASDLSYVPKVIKKCISALQ